MWCPRLSKHARTRLREREIPYIAVRDAVSRPFLDGETPDGVRFATAPEIVGGRRVWVTAICDGRTVITAWPGPPTPRCRVRA